MGLLRKPYELSIWEDVWVSTAPAHFEEQRICVIGSDTMEYQGRALEPTIARKTNGEVTVSFKMYYQFVDNATGEIQQNIFTELIHNETKIKLKYNNEWFDLLVKNIDQDSKTLSYSYQLVDQHVTELSKNGFNLTLDTSLMNNLGTAQELGQKILEETGTEWHVDSEVFTQTQEEALVMLTLPESKPEKPEAERKYLEDFPIYQIIDDELSTKGAYYKEIQPSEYKDLGLGKAAIYAFYSGCTGEKPYRFSFIFKKGNPGFATKSDRIISDKNVQYFIDDISSLAGWQEKDGFVIPNFFAIDTRESSNTAVNNSTPISQLYRGNRYVYNSISEYHAGLDTYLEKYKLADESLDVQLTDYWDPIRETVQSEWETLQTPGYETYWQYFRHTTGEGNPIRKPTEHKQYHKGDIVRIRRRQNAGSTIEYLDVVVLDPLVDFVNKDGVHSWRFKAVTIGNEFYKYTKTNYVTPNLIQNLVVNDKFKSITGWRGGKFVYDAKYEGDGGIVSLVPLEFFDWAKQWRANLPRHLWEHFRTPGRQGDYWYGGKTSGDGYHAPTTGEYCVFTHTLGPGEDEGLPLHIVARVIDRINIEEGSTDGIKAKCHAYSLLVLGSKLGGAAPTEWNLTLSSAEYDATITPITARIDGSELISGIGDMLSGNNVIGQKDFEFYLKCENMADNMLNDYDDNDKNNQTIAESLGVQRTVINNSLLDSSSLFPDGIVKGEKYRLEFEALRGFENLTSSNSNQKYTLTTDKLDVRIRVAKFEYDPLTNGYNFSARSTLGPVSTEISANWAFDPGEDVLFSFKSNKDKPLASDGYVFKASAQLTANFSVTPEELSEDNYNIFIEFPNFPCDTYSGTTVKHHCCFIKKLSIYKEFPREGKDPPYYTPDTPIDTTSINYNIEDRYFPIIPSDNRTIKDINFAPVTQKFKPILTDNAEKKSSVNIKESNYFNAIQSVAETFKAWPHFEVYHNSEGKITNFPDQNYAKKVTFKNYVGQDNFVGFKYGVNLKEIKRTIDSKQIVSKLIVKANANEYAQNGFCSIARASENSTRDNVIYNFGYYANKGLLNAAALQLDLYSATSDELTLIANGLEEKQKITKDGVSNYINSCTGFYSKLSKINLRLEELSVLISNNSAPLDEATASYNTYKVLYEQAKEQLEEEQNKFYKLANFPYNQIPDDEYNTVLNSNTLYPILETISKLAKQEQDALASYKAAKDDKEKCETVADELKLAQDNAILLKEELNKLFYQRYARFIQEGTWLDESYIDDSLYYNDALSVSYNSSMPRVNYSINVLALAGIPEYQNIDFKIGDQTFIEDVEFFGYNTTDKTPYHEPVVVSETSERLDDPSANTIKIQNYENQFQDLFQRITATVQQVEYTEGSMKKAEAFVEADSSYQAAFLSKALSDASTTLSNAAAQDWSLGEDGLTLESKATHDKLRAVGGAILLGREGANGKDTWFAAITNQGISADALSSGSINTRQITITDGEKDTFRWDSHGITAYEFDGSQSSIYASGVNKEKGVRFDRFGLYGYEGINGEKWKPSGINTGSSPIDAHSTFYLTWEGLKVKSKEDVELRIGNGAKLGKEDANFILRIARPIQGSTEMETTFGITQNGDVVWSDPTGGYVLTKDKIAAVLSTTPADTDGIYNQNGHIAINATAIRTGYLDFPNPNDRKNDYYIDPWNAKGANQYVYLPNFIINRNGTGEIAGWNIGPEYLRIGTLGSIKSFHMYSNDFGVTGKVAGREVGGTPNATNPGWKLAVGSNFGVDASGAVYASAGKIGSMTIEQINSLSGANLLAKSAESRTVQGTAGVGYKYCALNTIRPLETGKTYTISGRVKITVPSNPTSDQKKVGVRLQPNSVEWGDNNINIDIPINADGTFSGTVTTTNKNQPTQVLFYAGPQNTEQKWERTFVFTELKIEEGTTATPWCLPEGERMGNNVTGVYSWDFSPERGIYMYDTKNNSPDLVLKVDSGGLTVKGTIQATNGYIGTIGQGWNISTRGLSYNQKLIPLEGEEDHDIVEYVKNGETYYKYTISQTNCILAPWGVGYTTTIKKSTTSQYEKANYSSESALCAHYGVPQFSQNSTSTSGSNQISWLQLAKLLNYRT